MPRLSGLILLSPGGYEFHDRLMHHERTPMSDHRENQTGAATRQAKTYARSSRRTALPVQTEPLPCSEQHQSSTCLVPPSESAMKPCLLFSVLLTELVAPSAGHSSASLTVSTVYDSLDCSGRVVLNNYVTNADGVCTGEATSLTLPHASNYTANIRCCAANSSSILQYDKMTFGTSENRATWMVYNDKSCTTLHHGKRMAADDDTGDSEVQPVGQRHVQQ